MMSVLQIKQILIASFFLGFSMALSAQSLIDKKATPESKALYYNLKITATRGVMFGHQEDLAYGVNWKEVPGKSDVKDVCGDYPAVHGWDTGKESLTENVDGVRFKNMQRWIREVYERGGVNTVSWHVDNPVSGKNAWDTTRAVAHILPGGKDHERFVTQLDNLAYFFATCTSGSIKVPLIFRPFHEHNGTWFWWGKNHCSEEEYIQLWRFTVDYLKNKKGLHHLIYAFSPDRSRMDMNSLKTSFLYAYPGDDYVDIIGFDDYMDVGASWNKKSKEKQAQDLLASLKVLTEIANAKNKVAALTETGLEGIVNEKWYTEVILKPLLKNRDIQLAWFLVWRNANTKHHYAPYPGHAAAEDFVQFYQDPITLFESDVRAMYKMSEVK